MSGHLQPPDLERAQKGELPPEIRAHLADCAECRGLLSASDDGEQELTEKQPEAPPIPLGAEEDVDGPISLGAESHDGPIPWDSDPDMAAEAEENKPLERGESVGRYTILSQLGQGGMGVVYAAYDQELDRKIALKLLKPGRSKDGHARLLREAQAMARISHPNVLPVFDVGTLGDRVFVAMEYVDGWTLRLWLKQHPEEWKDALKLFLAAGRGLASAHEAGLVHRDFKPDNVLVGKDGRVFVTDFGLARLVSETRREETEPTSGPTPSEITSSRLNLNLTQAGMVMGTPMYMAPEQYKGPDADGRTDQFAFCAALYFGLWRKRPFDPQKIAVAAAMSDTDPASTETGTRKIVRTGGTSLVRRRPNPDVIAEPPPKPKIPTWLRNAVLQGLALDPNERHPSMTVLLDQIERRLTTQKRGVWAAAATTLILAGTVGVVGYRAAEDRAQLCSGGPARFATVWNDATRTSLETAFVAAGGAEAKDQATRTAQALDRYSNGWVSMFQEACVASRIREEEPESLFTLRTACLDRRLQETRTLVGLFTTADAKLVSQSIDAVQNLTSVRHCGNVAALLERAPMPEDLAMRQRIEALQAKIDAVSATRIAGRYAEALKLAIAAATDVGDIRYRPVEAEALYQRGVLEDRTGLASAGEATLQLSYAAADAGRDDILKAQAANRLVFVLSQQSRFPEAHRWLHVARAAVERLGGNRELEAELLTNEGNTLVVEGRYEEAVAALEQALKLISLDSDENSPRRLTVTANLANALRASGHNKEAIPMLEGVLRDVARIRGPEHPTLFAPTHSLTNAYLAERRFVEAHAKADVALAFARTRFGPNHIRVPQTLDLKATIYQEEGRFEEAMGTYRAALAIKEKTLPPTSLELSFSLDGIAQCLLGMGRAADSLPYFERALALRGPDPVGRAETQFGFARALWETGRDKKRALKVATEAKEHYRSAARAKEAENVERWLAARS